MTDPGTIAGIGLLLGFVSEHGARITVMRAPDPTNHIEELFIPTAAILLPVEDAEIIRLDNGILKYSWQSPCNALNCLLVYVNEYEIMLSTRISRTHIEG